MTTTYGRASVPLAQTRRGKGNQWFRILNFSYANRLTVMEMAKRPPCFGYLGASAISPEAAHDKTMCLARAGKWQDKPDRFFSRSQSGCTKPSDI